MSSDSRAGSRLSELSVDATVGLSVELVAHASIVVRVGNVRLLTDPWWEGSVFADGWAPVASCPLGASDLANIDYIWISHGHPDHFHRPTLSHIAAVARPGLCVLLPQSTEAAALSNALRRMGYRHIRTLPRDRWVRLGDNFDIRCVPFDPLARWEDQGDSCLFVRHRDLVLLNLNDCAVEERWQARGLLARAGIDRADILCTQFSYGQWAGNVHDESSRAAKAGRKLQRLSLQASSFGARWVIPFASFFRFCHEENAYLNDPIVEPGDVLNWLQREGGASPVILRVGDWWHPGLTKDFEAAAADWAVAYEQSLNGHILQTQPVPVEDVLAAAATWIKSVGGCPYSLSKRRLLRMMGLLPHATIRLRGLRTPIKLDPLRGIRLLAPDSAYDIELTADAAMWLFSSPYGPENIRFAGRFTGNGDRVARFLSFSTACAATTKGIRSLAHREGIRIASRQVARIRYGR